MASTTQTPPLSPANISKNSVLPSKTPIHTYIPSPNHVLTPRPVKETQDNEIVIHENTNLPLVVAPNGSAIVEERGNTPTLAVNPEINGSEIENQPTRWCSLLKTVPPSAGKEKLSFIEPVFKDGILQIEEDILNLGSQEWEDRVVGFFLDKKLPFSIVKAAVHKKWKLSGHVDISLDDDTYYFKFHNPQDRVEVLEEGTIHIAGKLFILRPWTREIEDSKGLIRTVPMWINMYKVPKHLWHPRGFSSIASALGHPLCLDRATESRLMLSFARVCVEIKPDVELPNSLTINTLSERPTVIELEYQWKPLICTFLSSFWALYNKMSKKSNNEGFYSDQQESQSDNRTLADSKTQGKLG
ncbi:hypothetical protein FRX31_032021 [Thalictrum thalictroides]|uniref:DUF4283 domain-containing protein n=1 Tax=Thalictrum thalictroides TaxID=46969 RepID=A0A7J6V0D9_THATH|nr:hypothetical protein FRX31_032021 [Thalictrum thalictroides]